MAEHHSAEHSEHHVVSLKVYFTIFFALMVFTALTVGAAFMDLGGSLNVVIALTIAVIKATLVILYFMHVRYGTKLLWVVIGSSFFWLGILFVLILGDYLTRGWLVFP